MHRLTTEGILNVVNAPNDLPGGPAVSVGRLVMLLVLLVGFIAMHGLAATNGDGTHHSPLALSAAADMHSVDAQTAMSALMVARAMTGNGIPDHGTFQGSRAAEATPTTTERHGDDAGGFHAAMAGCLIALCGLLTLAPARRSAGSIVVARARETVMLLNHLPAARPDDPPPRPLPRISLCVLRV